MGGFGFGPGLAAGFGRGAGAGSGSATGATLEAIMDAIDDLGSHINDVVGSAAALINGNTDGEFAAAGTDFLTPTKEDAHDAKVAVTDPGSDLFTAIADAGGGSTPSDIWGATIDTLPDTSPILAGASLAQLWKFFDLAFQSGWRSAIEPWFVYRFLMMNAVGSEQDLNPSVQGFGNPQDQGSSESDLAYMNRVSGGLAWTANYYGTGKVGLRAKSGGLMFDMWYSPEQVTAEVQEPAFAEAFLAVQPSTWATRLPGVSIGQAMAFSGAEGMRAQRHGLMRTEENPHFLTRRYTVHPGGTDQEPDEGGAALHTFAINPEAQEPGENDVAFLNRVASAVTWSALAGNNWAASASAVDTVNGVVEEYFYAPLQRSSTAIRQFAYRWSDGSIRSVLEDLQAVLAWVPVVLASLPDQSGLNGG